MTKTRMYIAGTVVLVVIAAYLLLRPRVVSAATRYASTTGSGTACTVITTPCTLNTAISQLVPGDILYLRAGTYNQHIVDGQVPTGNSSARVTISAYPGNCGPGPGPSASCEQVIFRPNTTGAIIEFGAGQQYITVSGVVIDGSLIPDIGSGFSTNYGPAPNYISAQHIRLEYSEVMHVPVHNCGSGVRLFAAGTLINFVEQDGYHEVIGNHIHHNGDHGTMDCGGSSSHGMYVVSSHDIIDGNDFHNNDYDVTSTDMQFYGASEFLDDNTVRNNTFHAHSVNMSLQFYAGINSYVYNNLFFDTTKGLQHGQNSGNGGRTNFFYNNTFYLSNSAWVPIEVTSDAAGPVVVTNNIVYAAGTKAIDDITPSNGFLTATANLCRVGDGVASHCAQTGNPLFVNTGTTPPNLHITSMSSPAFGNGSNLSMSCPTLLGTNCSTDKDAVARVVPWDIGAYKVLTTTPPPDVIPIEDFVYSSGVNISGQMGGNMAWTSGWTNNGGTYTADAMTGSFTAGNAAHSAGSTTNWYYRNFGAVGTGIIPFQMRWSNLSVTGGCCEGVVIGDAGQPNIINVHLVSDGHVHVCPGTASDTDILTPTANTTYFFEVQLDHTAQLGKFRIRVNGGTFSSYLTFCNAATSGDSVVSRFGLYDDAVGVAHDFYVDSIGANATMLAFTTQPPGSTVSGAAFAANVSVTYSNGTTVVPGRTDSITLSVCPSTPIATLTAASGLTKAAVNGTATWTDLVLTQASGAMGVLLCAHTGTTGIADGTSTGVNVTPTSPPITTLAAPARIRARTR